MASIRAWLLAKIRSGVPKAARSQLGEPTAVSGQVQRELPSLTANVPDEQMYTWESQAAQYPSTGSPGLSYFRGELSDEAFVDCLLYRDETGRLVGILNHYPMALPPHEREGDENIWVHPDHRRQGIGSTLMLEARFRWGLRPDAGDPKVTETGLQWLQGLEDKYGGSEYDWRAVGWEAWRERRAQERENPEADWRAVGWEVWHKRWEHEQDPPEDPQSDHHSNP